MWWILDLYLRRGLEIHNSYIFSKCNMIVNTMKEKTKEKIEDAVYFIITLICIIVSLGFLGFLVYGLLAGL